MCTDIDAQPNLSRGLYSRTNFIKKTFPSLINRSGLLSMGIWKYFNSFFGTFYATAIFWSSERLDIFAADQIFSCVKVRGKQDNNIELLLYFRANLIELGWFKACCC